VVTLPNMKQAGFKAVDVTDQLVYEFLYRVVVRCDEADAQISIDIMKPGFDPADDDELSANYVMEGTKFDLVSSAYNPVPM
jgi:hypothetical protein